MSEKYNVSGLPDGYTPPVYNVSGVSADAPRVNWDRICEKAHSNLVSMGIRDAGDTRALERDKEQCR